MAVEQKFIPCHGNATGAHPPIVFLRKKLCKGNGAISTYCAVCGTRTFHAGDFWKSYGYTRAQAIAMCPQAIDGSGQSL